MNFKVKNVFKGLDWISVKMGMSPNGWKLHQLRRWRECSAALRPSPPPALSWTPAGGGNAREQWGSEHSDGGPSPLPDSFSDENWCTSRPLFQFRCPHVSWLFLGVSVWFRSRSFCWSKMMAFIHHVLFLLSCWQQVHRNSRDSWDPWFSFVVGGVWA